MKLKGLTDEDFLNYRKPSMFLAFPSCTFKCEKECGICCCQNSALAKAAAVEVAVDIVVARYMKNPISQALVCGGLEPLDSPEDLLDLVEAFRKATSDPIVIYTGYTEAESVDFVEKLRRFPNIIVKFGRFVPDASSRYDELLGVTLASDNQYAVKIS